MKHNCVYCDHGYIEYENGKGSYRCPFRWINRYAQNKLMGVTDEFDFRLDPEVWKLFSPVLNTNKEGRKNE